MPSTTPQLQTERHEREAKTGDTHPAARILQYLPGYRKALHGPLIASRIGLAALRQRCPHFAAWIDRLERLAP